MFDQSFRDSPKPIDVCTLSCLIFNYAGVVYLFQNYYFEICNGMPWKVKMFCHYVVLVLSFDVKSVHNYSFVQSDVLLCIYSGRALLTNDGILEEEYMCEFVGAYDSVTLQELLAESASHIGIIVLLLFVVFENVF